MRDKLYEEAKIHVREFRQKNPQTTRRDRFTILESLCGIDEGTARVADRYLRAVRDIYPKDGTGSALSDEWRKGDYIHQWENEVKQQIINFK